MSLAGLSLLLASGHASAQEAATAQEAPTAREPASGEGAPSAADAPTEPPVLAPPPNASVPAPPTAAALLPPPAPPPDAAPPPAPSAAHHVRIHAHSRDNRAEVFVEALGTDGAYRTVCASAGPPRRPRRPRGGVRHPFRGPAWGDCVADVAPGSQLRIKLGKIEETHVFVVPNDPGGELDLEVLPAARIAEKVGGVVMIVLGSPCVVLGGFVLAISSGDGYLSDPSLVTPSLFVLVGGAILVGGGVALLASGSREPRVEGEPTRHAAAAASHERRDDVRGDVASTRPPDLSAALSAPIMPLSYGFSF